MTSETLQVLDGSLWIALERVTGEPCHVARSHDEVSTWVNHPERHPYEFNIIGPYQLSAGPSGLWVVFDVDSADPVYVDLTDASASNWISDRHKRLPFSGQRFRVTGPWRVPEFS